MCINKIKCPAVNPDTAPKFIDTRGALSRALDNHLSLWMLAVPVFAMMADYHFHDKHNSLSFELSAAGIGLVAALIIGRYFYAKKETFIKPVDPVALKQGTIKNTFITQQDLLIRSIYVQPDEHDTQPKLFDQKEKAFSNIKLQKK